ncbi:MAG: ChrR family anti-sigma-E factor [Aliihoeflea sp.]|jgi:putative transcriptional regulator|uniref:ChrR family anti-sigma-E factor n=1 Tax=Aliihoeflea sp. TaxID=2608088 RepID=UPI004034E4A0
MTAETIETIDALMARYAAGTLPYPAHILVQSHLEITSINRDLVAGLEELASDALQEAEPQPISDRAQRLTSIFGSAPPADAIRHRSTSIFPTALRDFVGFDADEVPWRTKMPGFREYDMDVDGCHASLFWIKPGRKIPAHTHEGQELTLVLDGAFTDIFGRYGRGDISVANEAIDHRPIAEKERPCIGFAITDAPLRFTGPLGQRLTDILGA